MAFAFFMGFASFIAACAKTENSNSAIPSAPGVAETRSEAETRLIDLQGNNRSIHRTSNSKALVLVFILADCPICNSYIPELNRLYHSCRDRGISMCLVHADPGITAEQAIGHAEEYRIELPVALDAEHYWTKKAGATIAPEAAVFSPTGDLLYRGRIDNQYAELGKRRATVTAYDLRDAVDATASGRPIAMPRTEAIGCLIPRIEAGP